MNLPEKKIISHLPRIGLLRELWSPGYWIIVVDDQYIEQGFQSLSVIGEQWIAPRFSAHISVIYPEEKISERLDTDSIGEVNFEIVSASTFAISGTQYMAWELKIPQIETLRIGLGLPPTPVFRGLPVPFHITFARQKLAPILSFEN